MHEKYMREALIEAKHALEHNEVPIGCVIVQNGEIIARGFNRRETSQMAIAHAEIIAIEEACKHLESWRLNECSIYVTLEPCLMCTGAISLARFKEVVFGAGQAELKSYNGISGLNHYPNVIGGVLEEECTKLLKDFFKSKRKS